MTLGASANRDAFLMAQPQSFERFENMVTVLSEKLEAHPDFRCILFVQQRVTTHIVQYYLSQHKHLGSLIKSRLLYATDSPATASLKFSKTDRDKALQAFALGSANLLISTSVAEEGLDIPAANAVIYLDPINNAVSYVQGRGRARQENSSFTLLSERIDRPATVLAQQEREQHKFASSFEPRSIEMNGVAEITAQKSRERGANVVLFQDVTASTAVSTLNLYFKKCKVVPDERYITMGDHIQCTISYASILRNVSAIALADSKKEARYKAATQLLLNLRSPL